MIMKSIHSVSPDMESLLEPLMLPEDALTWLMDLHETLQGLDDWYDGDMIPQCEKVNVIHNCLVGLSGNPFFLENAKQLLPHLSNLILKWSGANYVEENRMVEQYPKAYMWRAGFYDIILAVIDITYGFEAALRASPYVLSIYGESLDSYKKEFTNG
jgi:hypothetical protein